MNKLAFLLMLFIVAFVATAHAITMNPGQIGVAIEDRYLTQRAMCGDMVLVISPTSVTPAPRTTLWTRNVTVTLKDSDGNTHRWFTGAFAQVLSIADAGGGTATIATSTIYFVNGVATVTISGDAATWANAETDTLTISDISILGYVLAGGTSVETFTTP